MADYKEISEGRIALRVPVSDLPEHARRFGFYNPEMKADRDISVCCASAFARIFNEKFGNKPSCCDLLSATGARAIRYAKECGLIVVANDSNENAIALAKENAKLNHADDMIEFSETDANSLLAGRGFDIIDIDPFGSPYPFMDSAARSISDFGMVCVTATDTAVLFGTYPDVCEKRYGIASRKCMFFRELGARILLSFAIREFAKYDKAFIPMLCYSRRHYVRIFGMVEHGAEKTKNLLEKFQWLSVSRDSWKTGNEAIVSGNLLGKIYAGPMKDREFFKLVIDESTRLGIKSPILKEAKNELDELFYYDFQELNQKTGMEMNIDDFVFLIARKGFLVSRTPFCESGIRTNASRDDLEKLLRAGKFA